MNLKLRFDYDLLQRMLVVVFAISPGLYLFSMLQLPIAFISILLGLALGIATLKSCLQLNVEGRSVLVTGCDTGFGLKLAPHLAQLGFTVFAGCLDPQREGGGGQQLRALGNNKLHVLQLDVTKEEDWEAIKQYVASQTADSGLWGIVHNAGWATFGEVEWVSLDTYRRAMDINVFGVVQGTKTLLPLIRKAKGRVVTITSGLAVMAVPSRTPYILTKYAMEGFHDALRYEMRRFGVKVSMLEPGNYIAGTNIFNPAFVKSQADLMWNNMDQEVKTTYTREYFDKKVGVMSSYMTGGVTDISPVINSYTDALLDAWPQARYQPMNLYFKVRVLIAHHLPEAVYESLYV